MNISSITSKGVKHEVIDATARAKAEDNAKRIAQGGVNLQEKEAVKNEVVEADEGYDGLSKVTVNVPVGMKNLYCYTSSDGHIYTIDDVAPDAGAKVLQFIENNSYLIIATIDSIDSNGIKIGGRTYLRADSGDINYTELK